MIFWLVENVFWRVYDLASLVLSYSSINQHSLELPVITHHYTLVQTIRETILSAYPNHDFLGEEDVPPGAEASAAAIEEKLKNCKTGYLWIVDPIDGTVSLPLQYCIAIMYCSLEDIE